MTPTLLVVAVSVKNLLLTVHCVHDCRINIMIIGIIPRWGKLTWVDAEEVVGPYAVMVLRVCTFRSLDQGWRLRIGHKSFCCFSYIQVTVRL